MAKGGKRPNTGGKMPGAGRPPRAVEEKVREHIIRALRICGDDESMAKVWKTIVQRSLRGDPKFTQLLLNYYYGKPKENMEKPTTLEVRVIRQ